MKNNAKIVIACLMTVLLTMTLSADCYAQKKAKKAKKTTAPAELKLEYNFPEGKPLSYFNKTTMYQTMDFGGQTMNANIVAVLSATATGKGKDGNNLRLEIRIDTMSQQIDTPQGGAGGIVNDVAGKSFTMSLSPSGKEVDLSNAEKIVFSMEGIETNVSQSFIDYFPDLPAKPVKPGDTWTSNDTINSKAATASMIQLVTSQNKFEGIEKVDGIDCAKITSTLTGSREQKAQTMGMDITTTGTFTGTAELYFAIKEGYYIKASSTSKMNGNIEIASMGMTAPLVADMISVARLKK